MQKTIDRENTIQAIRMYELTGLSGTADALKKILEDLREANCVVDETRSNNVAKIQKVN